MAFRYRLEKLLDLKRIDENRAVEKLAVCRDARDKCDLEVTGLLRAYSEACRVLAAGREGRPAVEYQLAARRLQLLDERIQDLFELRSRLDEELGDRRAETSERVSARQTHERLRDRALAEWRRGRRKQERRRMDEAGSVLSALDLVAREEVYGE